MNSLNILKKLIREEIQKAIKTQIPRINKALSASPEAN